jgi:hypothetical protein
MVDMVGIFAIAAGQGGNRQRFFEGTSAGRASASPRGLGRLAAGRRHDDGGQHVHGAHRQRATSARAL